MSIVTRLTGWTVRGQNPDRSKIFFSFPRSSNWMLGPNHALNQWVPISGITSDLVNSTEELSTMQSVFLYLQISLVCYIVKNIAVFLVNWIATYLCSYIVSYIVSQSFNQSIGQPASQSLRRSSIQSVIHLVRWLGQVGGYVGIQVGMQQSVSQ